MVCLVCWSFSCAFALWGAYGELLYLLGGVGCCLLVLVVECSANCFLF